MYEANNTVVVSSPAYEGTKGILDDVANNAPCPSSITTVQASVMSSALACQNGCIRCKGLVCGAFVSYACIFNGTSRSYNNASYDSNNRRQDIIEVHVGNDGLLSAGIEKSLRIGTSHYAISKVCLAACQACNSI